MVPTTTNNVTINRKKQLTTTTKAVSVRSITFAENMGNLAFSNLNPHVNVLFSIYINVRSQQYQWDMFQHVKCFVWHIFYEYSGIITDLFIDLYLWDKSEMGNLSCVSTLRDATL